MTVIHTWEEIKILNTDAVMLSKFGCHWNYKFFEIGL